MGFKSVTQYNEEKFNGLFLLRNDGDYADVVFLYRGIDDVLVADTHYIKSADYSGYVHCCGRNCPACAKNIRVQTKLFIPLYNISDNEIQFFDRSIRFEQQLTNDVFNNFPNPSEFVFRITRHGVAGDVNTTYAISVAGKNSVKSYDQILREFKATFPDYYENICRDVSAVKLSHMLNASNNTSASTDVPAYTPTPRVTVPPISKLDMVEDPEGDDDSDDSSDPGSALSYSDDSVPAFEELDEGEDLF